MAAILNISLPDSLRVFVEEAVAAGEHASVSEYMRALVERAKTEKDLEARLVAALESEDLGAIGTEVFDELRRKAKKASQGRD